MALPKSVIIRELGPREGFQTITNPIPTAQKLELINALSQTGVKEIEITSLVRADKVPQMADADQVIRNYQRHPGIEYTALYLNLTGYHRAEELAVIDGKPRLENKAWVYVATSDTFLMKNQNTTFAQVLSQIPEWLKAFDAHKKPLYGLMVSTAFGCNYEGEISPQKVLQVVQGVFQVAKEYGKNFIELSLADTVGRGNPEGVRRVIGLLRSAYPALKISLHLHDTRGTGMANVYAGLSEGIDIFDGSVGGMGGCPFAKGAAGNVPTEDVIYLCEELGIKTGINIGKYIEAARKAEQIVGTPLPGKLYKAYGLNTA